MRRTRTLWRFFLAHQDARQEAWFEAQARQGWHLMRPGLFAFTFAAGDPCESTHRLDYQALRGDKRTEYLTLFRDAGWDFLGEKANRYYFRARPEALSPDIHSDPESRKDLSGENCASSRSWPRWAPGMPSSRAPRSSVSSHGSASLPPTRLPLITSSPRSCFSWSS
jgi:hypothetical protein